MSGIDVSGIRDLPSPDESHLCDPDEHVIVTVDGHRECAVCEMSLQALGNWFGHDVGGAA